MLFLAQTMPGTEFVPVALFCTIVGWIAGFASLVLSIPRATRLLAFIIALLACASTVVIAICFFMAHESSLGDTASAFRRAWLALLIMHVTPLFLGAVAVAVFAIWPTHACSPGTNHCTHCGYNLTGLPEPRCPECGRPFEQENDKKTCQDDFPGGSS